MSVKSIAQSETINIPLETKIEVVKTLVSYPLLIKEIDLTNNLLESSQKINVLLQSQLDTKDEIIKNNLLSIKALEEEKKLFKTQLKKQKLKSVKIGVLGLLIIGTILTIN